MAKARSRAGSSRPALSEQDTWDQAGTGKLIFMTLPSGQLLYYGYDALGRVTSVSVGPGYGGPFTTIVSGLSYFPYGGLRGIEFANGLTRWGENVESFCKMPSIAS